MLVEYLILNGIATNSIKIRLEVMMYTRLNKN